MGTKDKSSFPSFGDKGDNTLRGVPMSTRRKNSRQRGYNYTWEKVRELHLIEHPLCVFCAAHGMTTAASVVDHIIPHRGDRELFWKQGNLQSLCPPCHSSTKQRIENGQPLIGTDGWPVEG